jgi:type IX secretion system PorP/SprF family membrane protein
MNHKKIMSKKILLSIGVLLINITNVLAQQDKHFSMFQISKVQSNPAAAGFFEGDYQLFTNYRNQWMTVADNPFTTISASFDTRIKASNGFIGTGINFYNDVSGDARYMVNQITVPVNYAIELSKNNHISLGLAPSFYQRSISGTNVTWDNQWTGVAFDQSVSNGEPIPNENISLGTFDLNAGIFWQGNFSKFSWLGLGVSGQHLTKQKINYFNIDNGLYRKVVFSAYGNFSQNNSNFTLKPNAMAFIQGPNKMLVLGSGFDFLLKGKSLHTAYNQRTSIEFGVYGRVKDALIANVLFHMSGLTIGASFDYNVSSLSVATGGVGAMEFLLAYKFSNARGLGAPSIH